MRALSPVLLLLASGCFSVDASGAFCTDDSQCGPGGFCVRDGEAITGRCNQPAMCPDHIFADRVEPGRDVVIDDTRDYARKATCAACDDGDGVGADAPDVAYRFTSDADGTNIFRTIGAGEDPMYDGSSFPTVLYAYAGAGCDGEELVFDATEPGDADNESVIAPYLAGGETITVVIDGRDAEGGPFRLEREDLDPTCHDGEPLGGAAIELADTSEGRGNSVASSCGDARSVDYAVPFTADARGLYLVQLLSHESGAVVSVRDGMQCDSAPDKELACSGSPFSVSMLEGASVTIAVDGKTPSGPGAFELAVDRCAVNLPTEGPQVVDDRMTVAGTVRAEFSPSCAGSEAMRNSVDGVVFTAAAAGRITISIAEGAVVGVKRGSRCEGAEIGCVTADSPVTVEVAEHEQLTLFVQTLDGPSPYELTIQ